jgi:hypothetical protein
MKGNNMSKETQNQFILFFRGTDWHKALSPEEMQNVAGQMMTWFKGLSEKGIAVAGQPLDSKGKVVSGKGGRVVADGPFAESKEAIGGYFMLNVETLDLATSIAKQCPLLAYGAAVEVRPVLETCPLCAEAQSEEKADSRLAGAAA